MISRWKLRTGAALVICVAFLGTQRASAQESPAVEKPGFLAEVARNLFNSRGLLEVLRQPQYTVAGIAIVNAIVFTETGLLVGFFLPGDSLLVTTGLVAHEANWPLWLLLLTVCLSAIIGDSVGYTIGLRTGPRIFCREKSFFFKKDHLLHAQRFYEKHGGKTIILARFIPILRTFAPVVAGVGKMEYRRFLFYNIFGGVGWVTSMIMLGYLLPSVITPLLQPIFGQDFAVQDHIEKVIVLVVLASISPGVIAWIRMKFSKRPVFLQPTPEMPEVATKETVA